MFKMETAGFSDSINHYLENNEIDIRLRFQIETIQERVRTTNNDNYTYVDIRLEKEDLINLKKSINAHLSYLESLDANS